MAVSFDPQRCPRGIGGRIRELHLLQGFQNDGGACEIMLRPRIGGNHTPRRMIGVGGADRFCVGGLVGVSMLALS